MNAGRAIRAGLHLLPADKKALFYEFDRWVRQPIAALNAMARI